MHLLEANNKLIAMPDGLLANRNTHNKIKRKTHKRSEVFLAQINDGDSFQLSVACKTAWAGGCEACSIQPKFANIDWLSGWLMLASWLTDVSS